MKIEPSCLSPNLAMDRFRGPALLLNVAVKLEGSGKREAAETCYRQIVERFAGSPPAREAAQRLASITRA